MLMAKSLVKRVRFVEIGHGGWDMHQNINDNLKKTQQLSTNLLLD